MINAKNSVVDRLATRVFTLEQTTTESSSQISKDIHDIKVDIGKVHDALAKILSILSDDGKKGEERREKGSSSQQEKITATVSSARGVHR